MLPTIPAVGHPAYPGRPAHQAYLESWDFANPKILTPKLVVRFRVMNLPLYKSKKSPKQNESQVKT